MGNWRVSVTITMRLKIYVYHRGYLDEVGTRDNRKSTGKNLRKTIKTRCRGGRGGVEKQKEEKAIYFRHASRLEHRWEGMKSGEMLSKQLNVLISAVSVTNSTETKSD